jgi:tetratricopeptide (TPR) repeat protein
MNRSRAKALALLFFLSLWECPLCAQRAANLTPEPPPPKSSDAVETLLREANQSAQARNYDQGLKSADEALKTAWQSVDFAGVAWSEQARAFFLLGLNRPDEGVSAWKKAATFWRRLDALPERVRALCEAGLVLLKSNPGESEALLNEALSTARMIGNRPGAMARTLVVAGRRSRAQGSLIWARNFWQASVWLGGRIDPDSLPLARNLNDLGRVAFELEDLAAARQCFQEALDIWRTVAPSSLDAAYSLDGLGDVATKRGNLASAEAYYQEALKIQLKAAPDSVNVARTLDGLGRVRWAKGDLPAAAQYYRDALTIEEKQEPDSIAMAACLSGLGTVAAAQQDFKSAELYFRRARLILDKLEPKKDER